MRSARRQERKMATLNKHTPSTSPVRWNKTVWWNLPQIFSQAKMTPDLNQTQWPMLLRTGEHTCFSGQQQHYKSKRVCVCTEIIHRQQGCKYLGTSVESGNLLFVPALTAHFYCSGWITEGMVPAGWFTKPCPSGTLLFSAKLGEHGNVCWGSASCSTHICPRKAYKGIHHPHTLTCVYWCKASSV